MPGKRLKGFLNLLNYCIALPFVHTYCAHPAPGTKCMHEPGARSHLMRGQVMDGITLLDHMLQLDLYQGLPMRKVPNFVWGTDHMLKLCVKVVLSDSAKLAQFCFIL